MNTNSLPDAFLPHVSLIPTPIVYTTFRRHPIFFWHKTHIRSVICELVENQYSKLLEVEYTDQRTGNAFINKKTAELFLRKNIPENEHEGKLYVEKVRQVYAYYICKKCSCMKSMQTEIVFTGPFDIVGGPINTTTNRTCPNCGKASVQMDVSTEPTLPSTSTQDQDCDLAR